MHILNSAGVYSGRRTWFFNTAAVAGMVILLGFYGCFHHKQKVAAPKTSAGPVRIALLPFNIPADNVDLRWISLISPVLMAKAAASAPDLEIVPLWEGMPVARDTLGNSRSITPEIAAYVASRLTARWATQGEISHGKNEYSILVDFIPAKTTAVPFRYEKQLSIESMEESFREAYDQFSRYQILKPLDKQEARSKENLPLKEIAEALDREYGWFVTADPGKAEKVVGLLARTDMRLARLLFNPGLYPILGGQIRAPQTPAKAPVLPAAPELTKPKPPTAPPGSEASARRPVRSSPAVQRTGTMPQPVSSRAVNTIPELKPAPEDLAFAPPAVIPSPPDGIVEVPPPRYFIQRLDAFSPAAKPQATSSDHSLDIRRPDGKKGNTAAPEISTKPEPAIKNPHPANKKPPAAVQGIQIQVFATHSAAEAEAMLAKLTQSGYSSELEKVDMDGNQPWYRVRLGGYSTRQAARKEGIKLRTAGIIKDFWIVPR